MGYVPVDQIFGYKMWLESSDLKDSNGGGFHDRTQQNWQTFRSSIICIMYGYIKCTTLLLVLMPDDKWKTEQGKMWMSRVG